MPSFSANAQADGDVFSPRSAMAPGVYRSQLFIDRLNGSIPLSQERFLGASSRNMLRSHSLGDDDVFPAADE
jgi:hypothetical protein